MGEDIFGSKKFCYYRSTNPKGSKLALDLSTTKVYVTKEFKQKHNTFGGVITGDDFNGYPCEVMTGSVCSFPGEPGLPIESESEYETMKLESQSSSNEEENTQSESNETVETISPTDSGNKDKDNNDHNKKKKKKLLTRAIIGIVLGCLAFLALIILLVVCLCTKCKKNDNIETKDERKESYISLKKTLSKKDYESVDNIKDNQPEKLMV